jgi:hypothetical protein
MKREEGSPRRLEWNSRRKIKIKTTMLDLVSALNNEIKSGEEVLVPLIVLDMMDKGLLKFISQPRGKTTAVDRGV